MKIKGNNTIYEIDENLYNKLNNAWKSFSKSVLLGEIGELKDFMPFIEKAGCSIKHSELVGDILLAPTYYEYHGDTSRIKALKDIDFHKTFKPLNLNEMKDIDSIVEAIQERIYYTGNIILGNSFYIEKSTSIVDSAYIYRSSEMFNTKYSVFTERVRDSTAVFGCCFGGELDYVFGSKNLGRIKRSFSVFTSEISSNIYYSSGINNSQEIMFSFGQFGQQYVIGNTKLAPDKYEHIKKSLLEQIRQELSKHKQVPLLFDLIRNAINEKLDVHIDVKRKSEYKETKQAIDKSFSTVSKVVLGKSIHDIDSVQKSLTKRVPKVVYLTSPISHMKVQTSDDLGFIGNRIVEYEYITKAPKYIFWNPTSNLDEMFDYMRSKMLISAETYSGENKHIYDATTTIWSTYVYKVIASIRSKYVGFSYWPVYVEHGYGLYSVRTGSHIINTYMSKQIKRAFEVDNSRNSSDVYYCHNCEDVNEGMFSLNIKGKKKVIGNAELDSDKYFKIKKALMEQMFDEFSNNRMKYDIYTLLLKK